MVNKHVFIGREKELETLQQAYKEAQTGKGKLVLVSGNTGLGKSALIKTFFSQIEKDENTISGFSECTDMEDQNPYAPLKNLFIELNAKSYDRKITVEKLKDIMSEAGPSWVGMLPFIGNSLSAGITTFQSIRKAFSKNNGNKPIIENKDDVFRIFETELRRIAKKKTLIICIDDLQWADTSSLNVIYELGRKIRNNPFKILIIGSYRPNDIKIGRKKDTEAGLVSVRHPFAGKLNELRNYSKSGIHDAINSNWLVEISLNPFSKKEFKDYVNTLFVNNDFKESFYDIIFDLTDGDPLFVSEIIEQLHLNKSIEEIEGVYSSKELNISDLPKSVSASIAEKVERLNDVLKKILSYASVNGEIFMVEIIEKIMNIDGLELLDFLDELENKHNLLKEDTPIYIKEELFNQYQFSRSLVHKYIYDTLSNGQKRELHKRIAKNLLAIYGEVQIENNQSIKDKYLLHKQIGIGVINPDDYGINSISSNNVDETKPETSEYTTAATESLQKAEESYEQFAMDECHDFVNKTLAFLTNVSDEDKEKSVLRIEALLLRNKMYQWEGHYQKAFDTATEMANMANQIVNDEKLAQANLALGIAKSSLGYNKEAIGFFEKSIAYYGKTDNYSSLWKAYYEAGNTNHKMAAYDEAVGLFKKALQLSDKITDKNIKARTLLSLGKSYSIKLVNASIVLKNYNEALEIFKSNNNQYWVGRAYNDIGNEYRSESNNEKALEYLEKALDIAKDQNDSVQISNRLNNIALVYEGKEEYDTAIAYYEKTLAIDRQLDDIPMIAKSMNNIGSVYTSKGDFETAMGYIDKSHEIIKSINNPKELSTSYYTLATAYKSMDNYDKAEEYFLKSIAIDKDIKDEATLALHDYFFGFFYYENNRYKEASKYLEESLELLTKIGHKYFIAIINNTLGLIAKDDGNHEKAIEYFKPALDYYLEANDDFNILDVKENLANSYFDAKQYENAIELLQDSIGLAEQQEENTFLSRLYAKIGNAYFWTEKHVEANEFYTKEIAINSLLFGDKSKEVAIGNEHQANNYYWSNQYEEAIEYYLKVLDIITEIYGKTSKEVDISSFNLAEAYYYADNEETAKKLFEKSLVYRKETYGENSEEYQKAKEYLDKINNISTPTATGSPAPDDKQSVKSDTDQLKESIIKEFEANFATAYQHFEKEEYPEAIQNYEKALESLKLLPDDDATKKSKADIYFQIGQVNKNAKDYDAAITYFIESYNTYLKLSEVNKNDLGTICILLGDVYYIKDDYKNAIENHKEALELLKNTDASNNNMLAWANFNLGNDYYWNKQYEEAIIYYRKSLNIKKELYGEEHREIVICLVKIGKSYFEKGDNLSAIQNLKNAYTINKNLYGASSREADEVLIMLGQAYFYSERKDEATTCLNTSLEFRKEFFGENSEEYKFIHKWIKDNM